MVRWIEEEQAEISRILARTGQIGAAVQCDRRGAANLRQSTVSAGTGDACGQFECVVAVADEAAPALELPRRGTHCYEKRCGAPEEPLFADDQFKR